MLASSSGYVESARAFLALLTRYPHADDRIAILNQFARDVSDERYPEFIKVLKVIGASDDEAAKRLTAETLAEAMRRGDPPSGSLTAWGISMEWAAAQTQLASPFFQSAPRRYFDPIEYLCAWHSQSTNRVPPLSDEAFRETLMALIRLFNTAPAAARTYQTKLSADVVNRPAGTFFEATRARITAIVEAWAQGLPPEQIALHCLKTDARLISAYGMTFR
jgi:hypothetical protein